MSESEDIKLSIGKWREDETNLFAIASFRESETVIESCRMSSLTESLIKLIAFDGSAHLVFDITDVTFVYAQAREVPSLRERLSEESLEASGVSLRAKDGSRVLRIMENLPLG